jgi:fumarate hydratase class II
MYIAAAKALHGRLVPALKLLRDALDDKAKLWADLPKIGRTHMMDAVPMTLGQEFSGYVGLLDENLERLESALPGLYRLALGGTAVGTGINAVKGFSGRALRHVREMTGLPFVEAANKFAALSAHDALVMASGVLKTVAVSLYKMANDIRLLGSGPRCGLQELVLPANEPGSSIMPGKVNPTQCEVMTMVAVQVMGYDTAVTMAGAGGMLELNVYKPVMIANVLSSARLLADVCGSFREFLVLGLAPNRPQLSAHLNRSLMLVTALSPVIGYDKAAQIAHLASVENLTLKEAGLKLGYVTAEEYDRAVDPVRMAHPETAGA